MNPTSKVAAKGILQVRPHNSRSKSLCVNEKYGASVTVLALMANVSPVPRAWDLKVSSRFCSSRQV